MWRAEPIGTELSCQTRRVPAATTASDGHGGSATVVADAMRAAVDVAAAHGLSLSERPQVLPGVANTVLAFVEAQVVAKVATSPRAVGRLPLEHAVAGELAALDSPAARPLSGLGPAAHDSTGFMLSFWHYIEPKPIAPTTSALAASLSQLHAGLDRTTTDLPHFTTDLLESQRALARPAARNVLSDSDRTMLLGVFEEQLNLISELDLTDHRLHGEPHSGNRLVGPDGIVWVDFESCCRGPREWDIAFLPTEASAHFADLDLALLDGLRRLNHARLATWRSLLAAEFPELRRHADLDLRYLREREGR